MAKKTFSFDDLGGRPGKVQSPAEKARQARMGAALPKLPKPPVAPKKTAPPNPVKPGLRELGSRKKSLKEMGY